MRMLTFACASCPGSIEARMLLSRYSRVPFCLFFSFFRRDRYVSAPELPLLPGAVPSSDCAMTASVYLAAMGPQGLCRAAQSSMDHAHYLCRELDKLGFHRVHQGEFFNEFLTDCPIDPKILEEKLSARGILMGLPVDGKILWCTTELNTSEKIEELLTSIKEVC